MNERIDRDLKLKEKIAENIQNLRKKRGWTQKELSERSGISSSTLSDYLNCRTLIKPGNVEKIAETFGVTKEEIDPSFQSKNNSLEDFTEDDEEFRSIQRAARRMSPSERKKALQIMQTIFEDAFSEDDGDEDYDDEL